MSGLYLGIDTSNYKTSVAVIDSSNDTLFDRSEFLEVPEGKRGLRQSDAFFKHSVRLPDQLEELCASVDVKRVRAVGVSSRPRRVEGSYMPCFLSGVNAAREIAALLGVPLYEFSHQEGHAAAIIEDPDAPIQDDGESLLFHLSGGTTEFLKCSRDEDGYALDIIGGTLDISIGQLIDRAGVAMGMPFPAGPYMDEVSLAYNGRTGHVLPKIKITDGRFNLSGAETKLLRTIENSAEDERPALIRELFDMIASLLMTSASSLAAEYNISTVFMAGGVASSTYIRNKINTNAAGSSPRILFGKPSLSGDNAVGIARLARRKDSQQ